MSIDKRKILKEDEGLSTPKPINRYEDSDIEKTIKAVLKKEFKDFTLEVYRHKGETEYINLNISIETDEIDQDLELNRYRIARILAEFRQSFFTELSKYLNVVNVKVGPYDYVKNNPKLTFNVTILLSDNNITNWATGKRTKTESKKDLVKEVKQIDSFSTTKDEFEVKDNLSKLGLKASVEKEGVVRVAWDNKKYSREDIQKLVEERKIKNTLSKIYESILKEFPRGRPKKVTEPVKRSAKLDPKTESSLKTTIKTYYALTEELERLEEEHRKALEKKYMKQAELENKVYDMMRSVNMNLYIVDKIAAKISKDVKRSNTSYKTVLEDLYEQVNIQTQKIIDKLKKKYTSSSKSPGQLSINLARPSQLKGIKNESISLNEGFIDWFKNLFSSFKEYLTNITSLRKKIQKVAKDNGII